MKLRRMLLSEARSMDRVANLDRGAGQRSLLVPSSRQQQGFILLISLILLIVVTVVSSYLVNFHGLQNTETAHLQRSLQAKYAAHSGMQWALYDVLQQQAQHLHCNQPLTTPLYFPSDSMAGFVVTIACEYHLVQDNTQTYPIYQLTVTAKARQFAKPTSVQHQLVETIKVCC